MPPILMMAPFRPSGSRSSTPASSPRAVTFKYPPLGSIINFNEADSLLLEVFTNEGTGTLVVERTESLSPEERTVGIAS